VTAGERDTGQDQRYARDHHRGDVLAEDQDAEHDRDHGQQVGDCGGDGRIPGVRHRLDR